MNENTNTNIPAISDFTNALEEIFKQNDDKLVLMKDALIDKFAESILGETGMASIEDYIKQCDLMGYSLEQYSKDLEESRELMSNAMESLREKYSTSEIRIGIIDALNDVMGTYFDLSMMRLAARDDTNIGIELVHPNAKLPTYAHDGDQGADIYAVEDMVIEPHTFGNMIPTGLKMLIPPGWAVAVRPRSGMSKNTTLRISNSPATIDQKYRGEVKILFDNIGFKPIEIKAGDRIAQFVLEKNYQARFSQVDTVEPDTERGEGGFGSSGN